MNPFLRNVPLLAVCQVLMMSATTLSFTASALVGYSLSPDKSLATLPLAIQYVSTMLTTIPAGLLMERVGRRRGFQVATIIGMSGGVTTTLAILQGNFWMFVAGASCVGIFNGFGNYYRFTAADAVDDAQKSRAISFVLAGGVIAALIGPNLAAYTRESITSAEFAGSYASLVVLYILSFTTVSFLKLPTPALTSRADAHWQPRPIRKIISQPKFLVAMICAMFGYGVMSLVMTATPLAMHHHAHAFHDTSFVIEWHILGMFAPSFFTGHLIRRFGVTTIMLTGNLFGVACVVINLAGSSIVHFWTALVLLGVSWNFLFIGATTLLTETYHPSERSRAQAINDFAVFSTVALASLSAGALLSNFGWRVVNLGVLPMQIAIFGCIFWLLSRQRVEKHKPG